MLVGLLGASPHPLGRVPVVVPTGLRGSGDGLLSEGCVSVRHGARGGGMVGVDRHVRGLGEPGQERVALFVVEVDGTGWYSLPHASPSEI